MLSLVTTIISTVVFVTAAWYINRAVAEKGIPAGMTRGFLVFLLASFVSLCAGEAADWMFATPQAAVSLTR